MLKVRLPAAVQKRLIADGKGPFSWAEYASLLGMTTESLRSCYHQGCLLPYCVYEKLDADRVYLDTIEEILPMHWGRSKGGKLSGGPTKIIFSPKHCVELAEFVGAVLGDGNIHAYIRGSKVRTYMVRIAGDRCLDKIYHENYLAPMAKRLFNIDPKFYVYEGGRVVILHSKKLVEFFSNMGIKPGNKIHHQTDIPVWIKQDSHFLQACLRGLYDTDGSIHRMSRRDFRLLRINFTAHNMTLMQSVREGLISLGFCPSSVIRNKALYLSRQADIRKFLKEIGFSNPRHLDRLKAFNSPVG